MKKLLILGLLVGCGPDINGLINEHEPFSNESACRWYGEELAIIEQCRDDPGCTLTRGDYRDMNDINDSIMATCVQDGHAQKEQK